MGKQIFNMGVEGAILEILINEGVDIGPEKMKKFEYLKSLPKNVWIDLDDNGKMITKEMAEDNMLKKIGEFRILK